MTRRDDLTLFAGFLMGTVIKKGGCVGPDLTLEDVHGCIAEYMAEFKPRQPEKSSRVDTGKREIPDADSN